MPNRPKGLPNALTVNSALSGAVPPSAAIAPTPPIWSAIPADPEAEHADGVDHEVHAMVCATFFARVKPVSTMREARLHEHDQEPGDSVQTMLIEILLWPTVSITSGRVGLAAILHRDVLGGAGRRTRRVVQGGRRRISLGLDHGGVEHHVDGERE